MAKSAEADRERAKFMKAHPGQFPDSIMKQGRGTVGTPAMAFKVQPARGGPIPHTDPATSPKKFARDAA